eukprot:CAMPEP_0201479394 /NCGR_PEP_ID=MMETSP0151_2-20130828/4101_1 /ASSEMBLY_ACC=CAM_ASM_000257 /TAXON_ID=200890 /ORGANISM="Paramoeba atlantica, Strain 621/1 / CCAP 1560/9" /LENGTH=222 /DNA_ID=CAMNT_0047860869 /DNA_START=92 /DNA_END=760 /DNA_ORIENTATION=-
MGFLFSKEEGTKAPQPTAHDRAVLDLKHQQDKLKVTQKRIEKVIARETEIAKECLATGKRPQALLALKKKKFQEKSLDQTTQLLMNVEELINSIDFAEREKEIFDSLKRGKDVLQQLNDEMKIEDVEKIMDDTREAIDYQNEISELLGQQLVEEDEAEVEAELEELLREDDRQKEKEKEKEKEKDGGGLKLPDVPSDPIELPVDVEKNREKQQERRAEAIPA